MKGLLAKIDMEITAMAAIVATGFLVVAGPVSDNSMLVHLATGKLILEEGIPRTDPYSFTAAGEPWIVQSWLAEWTYGVLLDAAGLRAVILEHMVVGSALALLMVVMLRTGSMSRTVLGATCAFTLALPFWAHRPFMFGLLWFAVVVYVVWAKRSAWWLLPVGWLWVNTHGSFPLGIAWVVAYLGGSTLDRGVVDRRVLKAGGALLVGVMLGAINPLGPKLLTFPLLALGDRSAIFSEILEWKAPEFRGVIGVAVLLALIVATGILVRSRVAWRHALPACLFLGAALYSVRNMPVLAIALCPALGEALRVTSGRAPGKGGELVPLATLGLLPVIAAVGLFRVFTTEPVSLGEYPVAAVKWIEGRAPGDQTRLAAPEVVGCYLIYERGATAKVFVDDRFDLYPETVSSDYLALRNGTTDPRPILDRHGIDAVLWWADEPLTQSLTASTEWVEGWRDANWVVFERK